MATFILHAPQTIAPSPLLCATEATPTHVERKEPFLYRHQSSYIPNNYLTQKSRCCPHSGFKYLYRIIILTICLIVTRCLSNVLNNQSPRNLFISSTILSSSFTVLSVLLTIVCSLPLCVAFPGSSSFLPGSSSLFPGSSSFLPGSSSLFPGSSLLFPGSSSLFPGSSSLFPCSSSRTFCSESDAPAVDPSDPSFLISPFCSLLATFSIFSQTSSEGFGLSCFESFRPSLFSPSFWSSLFLSTFCRVCSSFSLPPVSVADWFSALCEDSSDKETSSLLGTAKKISCF